MPFRNSFRNQGYGLLAPLVRFWQSTMEAGNPQWEDQPGRQGFPRLVRYLMVHCAYGSIAAVICLIGLIVTDTANIGTLIATSDAPVIPLAVLIFSFVITFGSVAMGVAIMQLTDHTKEQRQKIVERGRPNEPSEPEAS